MNTAPGILTTTLALSDIWNISLFVVNLGFNVVLAIALLYVRQATSTVSGLKAEVKSYADQLIDQKVEVVRQELVGEIRLLGQQLQQAENRLKSGDKLLGELRERDHDDELKTLTAINQLRRDVIESVATKADLQRVEDKHDKLANRVAQIQGAA